MKKSVQLFMNLELKYMNSYKKFIGNEPCKNSIEKKCEENV